MRAQTGLIRRCAFAGLVCAFVAAATAPAVAQKIGRNVPGDFDFYVLALSWSPSYCQAEGQRADRYQCAGGRPYSFVVHGLWPQYERGYPRDCQPSTRPPDDQTVRRMLDIMPSPGLVRHEWRTHGTCSGLTVDGYFSLVRKARDRIRIPAQYRNVQRDLALEPGGIETAFRNANPGLPADAIAVTCDVHRLREVRICMDKSLNFRSCDEVDRRSCHLNKVILPPARGR